MDLFGGRALDEFDTLGNVALEAFVASLEELLLMVVGTADDVDGLFGAVGLISRSINVKYLRSKVQLTPSSMGTEKKSVPVAFAILSPPATPGR